MPRHPQSGGELKISCPDDCEGCISESQYKELLENSTPQVAEQRASLMRLMEYLRDHNRKPGVLADHELMGIVIDFLAVEDRYRSV